MLLYPGSSAFNCVTTAGNSMFLKLKKKIFWRYLNRHYSMILIWCYYKLSWSPVHGRDGERMYGCSNGMTWRGSMEVVNVTSQIAYEMLRFDCFIRSAAVSCSSYVPLLGAGGIWFLVDGQAGLCMASMHGWCMGRCTALVGWEGAWYIFYNSCWTFVLANIHGHSSSEVWCTESPK